MSFQARDNSGSLFKNDKRREGKNDPEYTGTAIIGGQEFYMDCWVKRPENKKPFFSFSFKAKTARPQSQESRPTPQRPLVSKPRPPGSLPPPREPEYGEDAPDIDSSF